VRPRGGTIPGVSDAVIRLLKKMYIFAALNEKEGNMTAIEMKYSLFKEIDSIEDESVLYQLTAFIRNLLGASKNKTNSEVNKDGIPEFIRNMSVKTDMTGDEDVKEAIHKHWEEKYG